MASMKSKTFHEDANDVGRRSLPSGWWILSMAIAGALLWAVLIVEFLSHAL